MPFLHAPMRFPVVTVLHFAGCPGWQSRTLLPTELEAEAEAGRKVSTKTWCPEAKALTSWKRLSKKGNEGRCQMPPLRRNIPERQGSNMYVTCFSSNSQTNTCFTFSASHFRLMNWDDINMTSYTVKFTNLFVALPPAHMATHVNTNNKEKQCGFCPLIFTNHMLLHKHWNRVRGPRCAANSW